MVMATLQLVKNSLGVACLACLSAAACTPLRDLDAAASGFRPIASEGGSGGGVPAGGTSGHAGVVTNSGAGSTPVATGGGPGQGGSTSGSAGGSLTWGGSVGTPGPEAGGAAAAQSGAPAVGGANPGDTTSPSFLVEMPNDLADAPVPGDVTYVEASYSGQPTFQIATPTAIYTVVRQAGSIISLVDQISQGQSVQWIGYSDYRPQRRIGIVAEKQPLVSTVVDLSTVTAKHVRLHCQTVLGDWRWDWDFYVTQATLTITEAPSPFGFSYRGTPGKNLEDEDQLVLASGQAQSAKNSFSGTLLGPAGWAYLADSELAHSLFLIQHEADSIVDRYDSLDGDSASLVFGGGRLTQVPLRFSVGLVDSDDQQTVRARADFVIDAVP